MSKVIKAGLSESSIGQVLEELNKYFKDLEIKKKEFLKRLAELGVKVANGEYGGGASVSYTETANGVEIHATGDSVIFLEFGTGVKTDIGHPLAQNALVDVQPGAWSVQNQRQFYLWGYWYFNGVKMYGTEPKEGMYKADKEIQNQVYKIAKEVFGK